MPAVGLRQQHFRTHKIGPACSASFSTDHLSRNGWRWIHSLFHSSSSLDMKAGLLNVALVTAICLFSLLWWEILCKEEGCLRKYQWMENQGDFRGIILFQWGPGHTKYSTAHYILSSSQAQKKVQVHKQDISYVTNTLYTSSQHHFTLLSLLPSSSHICEIPE